MWYSDRRTGFPTCSMYNMFFLTVKRYAFDSNIDLVQKTLLEWTSVDQNCWHQVSKNIGNFKAFIVVVKSKIISIVFKDNTWNFENLKNFQTWQLVACNYKTQAREPLWQFSVNNMQPIPLFSRDVFIRAQVFSCKSSEIMKKYNNYCAIAKLHRFDEIWKIELWKLMSF